MSGKHNILYDIRKEKGLSHQQVAHQLGISINTLYKWENSLLHPSPGKMSQLAKLYDMKKKDIENIIPYCSAPGCDRRQHQCGLCSFHYNMKYTKERVNPIKDAPTMGDRLRVLREEREITLDTFANKFGITVSTVEAWECNWIKPSLHMLMDIAGFYGVGTRLIERGIVDE